jgi:cytochrome c peroxidase
MQKFKIVCCLFVAVAALLALQSSLTPAGTPTSERVRVLYKTGLEDYEQALSIFIKTLQRSGSSPDQWRQAFTGLRNTYKRVEFLLAYLEDEGTRDYLNGPPLPSINRVVAGVEVLEPAGMQIIEEILYSGEGAEAYTQLIELAHALRGNYNSIHKTQINLVFTDRQVLEAVRAGIFRITAMGLAGFDTPGSGDAIQEAAISMDAMREVVALYLPYSKNQTLADSIQRLFSGCIADLRQHPDFDTFDRLNCIRRYLEPLYGQLLQLHLDLGIETIYQVTSVAQPLEYLSGSMFSAATFNDHYYAGIGAREEKPAAVELGRMLFFDPILSANNQRACASCHQPEKAFTDGEPKSIALDHTGNVGRNAPTVINSALADKYFYDFRSDRLESQAEHVIFNEKEFNTTYYAILDKLKQSAEYREMFQDAFAEQPGIAGVSRALAAYVRSLKSFNSPVDRYLRGERIELAPEVQQGFNLFMGKALCGTCHFAPTFSGLVPPAFTENESEVIGVPLDPKANVLQLDPDQGRYENRRPRDRAEHFRHSFKTTTVRNAALTAPYMHNGAYKNLQDVVDFYNRGGGAGLGLDVRYQTLPFDSLNLSKPEQQALVRFMEALTDTVGLTTKPARLPRFEHNTDDWNRRKIGGLY